MIWYSRDENGVETPLTVSGGQTIQVNEMPVASTDYVGIVCQYIGATTANYTHNYFYECIEDTSTNPATYSWVQTNVQSGGGSGSGGIVKGYRRSTNGKFYEDSAYTTLIPGDDNTIYIDIPTKYQYEYNSTSRTFNELGEKMPSIATEYDVGITKPDNLTIFVDSTGTIRTRVWAGTQAEFDEQRYRIPPDTAIIIADSVVPPQGDTYVNGIKIVPWRLGTDEDIAAMMQGHYDGKINIYDYWNIGDTRTVHLNTTESNVKSLPPAYGDIEATLINKGYGNNDVAFAVSLFSPSHGWIFDDWSGCESWDDTKVKDWFPTLYNALPATIRSMFKPFDYVCATRYDSNTTTTYNDYFTFFSEKEIYGSRVYSNAAEANALQQIPWFTEKSHRVFFDESTVPTFTVMPEPSEEYVGKTYRYIGETTEEYTHNYYYMCTKTTNSYEWSRVTHSYYWTRSIGTASDKIVTYSRDNDSPYSVNTMGGGWLYVPFGCI